MRLIEKELSPDFNFTIILPGECNANCSFCFWDKDCSQPSIQDYITSLSIVLGKLSGRITSISITGGEPTISNYFIPVLNLITENRYRVVLNTNGSGLVNNKNIVFQKIDHINLSRHGFSDEDNFKIFKTNTIPSLSDISYLSEFFGKKITLVKVVEEEYNDMEEIYAFTRFIKNNNIAGLKLRKNSKIGTLEPILVENQFGDIRFYEGCPSCISRTYSINEVKVQTHIGLENPSEYVNYIYEMVFDQNGILYEDWNRKKPIKFINHIF